MASVTREIRRNQVKRLMKQRGMDKINKRIKGVWHYAMQRG